MKHQEEEKDNLDYVFYLVGLISGLFTGWILDVSYTYIFVGGVLGLLTAGLFLNVLVKGREEA